VVLASGSAFAAYEDKGEGYITASQLATVYDGSYVDIESEFIGSSLGIDMYEMNGYSDSEFVTRIFVEAELRVIQTVSLYFNTGVLTAFETNFDFSEVGLKVPV